MSWLLRDEELKTLIEASDPLVDGLKSTDHTGRDDSIQPASVDLTVGKIYLPSTEPHEPGGVDKALAKHTLVSGETVIVETKQKLHLPADIAGISFPPARISARGILTTNPGHIDPGYRGTLSFTVINMGRREFDLDADDDIVTVLFFQPPTTGRARVTELTKFIPVSARRHWHTSLATSWMCRSGRKRKPRP